MPTAKKPAAGDPAPASGSEAAAAQEAGDKDRTDVEPGASGVELSVDELPEIPVREGEDPWSREELEELVQDLRAEVMNHQRAIEQAEAELEILLHNSTEGAGRDPADVGSANFERDQEMSLAANAREMLEQTEDALRAIRQGSYGRCEHCGEPIGKGRLQVYPRAAMCVACKQRQERR